VYAFNTACLHAVCLAHVIHLNGTYNQSEDLQKSMFTIMTVAIFWDVVPSILLEL
jgi:hypothetical protein